jgi:DNA-binding CsgD family transcriptional regulator
MGIELMMIREAARHLTPKQAEVWNRWNYDRQPQDAIARDLGIKQQVVSRHIKAAERRIVKWVKARMHVYDVMVGAIK